MTKGDTFPELVLGTAMWGWTVSKGTAFQLLDHYYDAGFRRIDAATNYPINKRPSDFRRSEKILLEWIRLNNIQDLSILMKVGSISNMRTPDHNLKPAFLLLNWRQYLGWFESNLGGLMIHWDNREDKQEIQGSLEVLAKFYHSGLEVGFSGVQTPEMYASINQKLELPFLIQFKHNILHSDYPRYPAFHGSGRFYAYGINGGGIKLDLKAYHGNSSLQARGGNIHVLPDISQELIEALTVYNDSSEYAPVSTMNEVAMIFALNTPDLGGLLIGPSKLTQLQASLDFYHKLKAGEHQALFSILKTIHRKYAPADRQI